MDRFTVNAQGTCHVFFPSLIMFHEAFRICFFFFYELLRAFWTRVKAQFFNQILPFNSKMFNTWVFFVCLFVIDFSQEQKVRHITSVCISGLLKKCIVLKDLHF